jgi:hypothetical protein
VALRHLLWCATERSCHAAITWLLLRSLGALRGQCGWQAGRLCLAASVPYLMWSEGACRGSTCLRPAQLHVGGEAGDFMAGLALHATHMGRRGV